MQMKEISGERLYKNIQYYWVYKKRYPAEELKKRLGSRYTEYQALPKLKTVSNKVVAEYAKILGTGIGRLRMKDERRDGVINKINTARANKYSMREAEGYEKEDKPFIGTMSDTKKDTKPKQDTTSKKWNDDDARRLREFLERKRRGDIDDREFDRGAMK